MKAKLRVELMVKIGDWCITKDHEWRGKVSYGIYADHIQGCVYIAAGGKPVVVGDCCWASDDEKAVCFYCEVPVPPEIQALVHLQATL